MTTLLRAAIAPSERLNEAKLAEVELIARMHIHDLSQFEKALECLQGLNNTVVESAEKKYQDPSFRYVGGLTDRAAGFGVLAACICQVGAEAVPQAINSLLCEAAKLDFPNMGLQYANVVAALTHAAAHADPADPATWPLRVAVSHVAPQLRPGFLIPLMSPLRKAVEFFPSNLSQCESAATRYFDQLKAHAPSTHLPQERERAWQMMKLLGARPADFLLNACTVLDVAKGFPGAPAQWRAEIVMGLCEEAANAESVDTTAGVGMVLLKEANALRGEFRTDALAAQLESMFAKNDDEESLPFRVMTAPEYEALLDFHGGKGQEAPLSLINHLLNFSDKQEFARLRSKAGDLFGSADAKALPRMFAVTTEHLVRNWADEDEFARDLYTLLDGLGEVEPQSLTDPAKQEIGHALETICDALDDVPEHLQAPLLEKARYHGERLSP